MTSQSARLLVGCPIGSTLDVLGQKYALQLLRDAVVLGMNRYSQFERSLRGITPRMLSRRLRELSGAGFLDRTEDGGSVRYAPTRLALDAVPIMTVVAEFGLKHHAEKVFADRRPRRLDEFQALVERESWPPW